MDLAAHHGLTNELCLLVTRVRNDQGDAPLQQQLHWCTESVATDVFGVSASIFGTYEFAISVISACQLQQRCDYLLLFVGTTAPLIGRPTRICQLSPLAVSQAFNACSTW